jgi:hypothetical protein
MNNLFNFFPIKNYSILDNRDAIIKYCIYVVIILLILTKNWKLSIFFILFALNVYIISNIIINNQKKENFDCKKTTLDNPMGNLNFYDEINKPLCKNQDKKINSNLNYNIYYDSKDLFHKKNNTRSFITMPSQINPNDIDNFKNYLYYLDNPTCKYDSIKCMFNENIKYHKNYYYKK